MVDQLLSEMANLPVEGDTAVERIASLARSQRKALIERQHILRIAHERDRTPTLFLPIQQMLAMQLAELGITGGEAALVLRAVQVHVISSALLQFSAVRGPSMTRRTRRYGPTTGPIKRSSRHCNPRPTTTPFSNTDSVRCWPLTAHPGYRSWANSACSSSRRRSVWSRGSVGSSTRICSTPRWR
ncbi:tetR-family transcriptional regulator [Mycobacterium xenopi 3993]|nr:tetR-family transcriptional regulator [Mycobacterium xenopi 3993]